MNSPRYFQLDVFPARQGGGNPLGVVLDAQDWSDARMQRFATWTGLVETTFVLPPTAPEADYRLRIFTPSREIPFAGHPTVGSAHVVLETSLAQARSGMLMQECGAGVLPIRVGGQETDRRLLVRAPDAHIVEPGTQDLDRLRAALGDVPLGTLPPALIEGGRRWWVAEFADEAAIRSWRPDHAAIGELARTSDCLGLCVFARTAAPGHELVVRAFPAGVGIVEDPASGAANGLIAAWIAGCEPEGPLAGGYRVSQGREMGHDAEIDVRIERDGGIWVGGRATIVVSGSVDWA